MDGQETKEVDSTQKASQPQPVPGRSNKKRFAIGIIILLIFLFAAFGLYSLTRKQVPADILLATVGNEKIYKSTVEKVAEEQYVPSAIDNVVLKRFLDVTIERLILNNEAKKLEIVVSDSEISNYLNENKLSEKAKLIAKYTLLKEKIITSQIKNVEAYTVGFWIPPYSYPQEPEFDLQRKEGESALSEIEQKLKAGETASAAASAAYLKYPRLQNILAVNGYLLKTVTEQSLITTPKEYVFSSENAGQIFYDTLFSLRNIGEVRKIQGEDGSGGSVIKLVAINSGMDLGYEDWLNEKKKALVTMHNNLE